MLRNIVLSLACLLLALVVLFVAEVWLNTEEQLLLRAQPSRLEVPHYPTYIPEAPQVMCDDIFLKLLFGTQGPFELLKTDPEAHNESRQWRVLDSATGRIVSYDPVLPGFYVLRLMELKSSRDKPAAWEDRESFAERIAARLLGPVPTGRKLEVECLSLDPKEWSYAVSERISPNLQIELVRISGSMAMRTATEVAFKGSFLTPSEYAEVTAPPIVQDRKSVV